MRGNLALIQPINPETGQTVEIRVGVARNSVTLGLGDQRWHPAIVKPLATSIELLDEDMTGQVMIGKASLTISTRLIESTLNLAGLVWAGAKMTVWVGNGPTMDDMSIEFQGVVTDGVADPDTGEIPLSAEVDTKIYLDVPFLKNEFEGLTGESGDVEMRGTLRPGGMGRPINIALSMFDVTNNVMQIDAYGNLQNVAALYENAASFGPSSGNYASYDALVAATIAPGSWATCIAKGLVRLGAPPAGLITCDPVMGAGTPGAMVLRLIQLHTELPINRLTLDDFITLDAGLQVLLGEPCQVDMWTSEQISVLEIIQKLCAGINAAPLLMPNGQFRLTRAVGGAEAIELRRMGNPDRLVTDWKSFNPPTPWWRLKLSSARTYRVHTNNEIDYEAEVVDLGIYKPDVEYRIGNIVSLPDGSRWLFQGENPATGSLPSATNPNWFMLSQPITAGNIHYEDGTPVEDLKPAEPGATHGATQAERDKLDQLEVDTAAAQVAILAAQNQIDELEGSVSVDFSALNTAISTLNGEVDVVQGNITSLQSATSAVQQSVSTLQGDVAAAQTAISTINGQVADITNQVGTVSSNLSTLTGEVNVAKINIASLTTQVGTVSSDVTGLTNRISSAEGQISATASTVSTHGSLIQQNSLAISNVEGNLASLTTQVNAGTNPNLLPNGTGENGLAYWYSGHGVWGTIGESIWGQYFYVFPSGSAGEQFYHLVSNKVPFTGAATATFTCGVDFNATGSCDARLRLRFLNAASAVLKESYGPHLYNQAGFNNDAVSRAALKLTDFAPDGTTHVDVSVIFYTPNGVTLNGGAFRQAKLEFGSIATPYSADASIRQTFLAISTTDQSVAQLTTTVSANTASIGQQSTAISNLQGTTASLSSTVSTQGGQISNLQQVTTTQGGTIAQHTSDIATANANISTNAQAISTANGNIASLSSTVSTQGGQISNLQQVTTTQGGTIAQIQIDLNTTTAGVQQNAQAISTANGNIASLQNTVQASGGNLLQNTEFGIGVENWDIYVWNDTGAGFNWQRDLAGDGWRPYGEHNLGIEQLNSDGSVGAQWYSNRFPIIGGKWYEASAYTSSQRCYTELRLEWYDGNGQYLDSAYSGRSDLLPGFYRSNGGQSLANWQRLWARGQAPTGAVTALFVFIKYGTSQDGTWAGASNSYAWVCRPQVKETTASSMYPLPYFPGRVGSTVSVVMAAVDNANGQIASIQTTLSTATANISQNATAISSINGSIASLSSTVSAQGASISTLQSASSTQAGQIATLTTRLDAGSNPNLLPNGSGENGLADWYQGYGTWNVSTGGLWGSYFFANDGSTSGQRFYHLRSTLIGFQAGQRATAACDFDIFSNRTDTQGYLEIRFLDSGNNVLASHGGTPIAANVSFGYKEQRALTKVTTPVSPAGTAKIDLALVIKVENGGNLASGAIRQAKLEVGTIATPYSTEASVQQTFTALRTLNTSFASLETRVASAEGSVSTLQSSMTSANGSISSLQTSVSSLNGSVSSLQQSSSTQAGQISSLQSTVSTQGGQISTNAQAITTINGSLSQLNTIVTASSTPNLLPNGGFENGLRGWEFGGPGYNSWVRNVWAWGSWAGNPGFTGADGANHAFIGSERIGLAGDGSTYALSFDYDMQSNGGGRCYGVVLWLGAAGNYLGESQTELFLPKGFDNSGNSRVKVLMSAAAGATQGVVRIFFYAPTGVTISGMNVRQIKFEFGTVATPYSSEATAGQMYSAYADLNSSHASLSTTVSSQGGSIATLQSTTSTLNGTVSSLSSTVSAQGGSISSLQSVQSTHSGQIATALSRITLGGNVLQNTEFAAGTEGWNVYIWSGDSSTYFWGRNYPDTNWTPTNENMLGLRQLNSDSGQGAQWHSNQFPVIGGRWYEASANTASHDCVTEVRIDWYGSDGNGVGNSWSGISPNFPGYFPGNGGQEIRNWQRLWAKAQAPANATRGILVLSKYGTSTGASNSYAWFNRPQFAEVYADTQGPTAYFPGNTGVSIVQNANAISTLNGQYAILSSTVGTQGASISQNATAISTLTGNVATLSSTVSTHAGQISTLQSVTSTTTGNVATLTTRVQAGTGFNLVPNSTFENGLTGWTPIGDVPTWGYINASVWGNYGYAGIGGPVNGYACIDTARFNVDQYANYTTTFDFDIATNNNAAFDVWSEIIFFGSNGIEISRTPGQHVYGAGNRGFWYGNGNGLNRVDSRNNSVAPVGAVQALVRVIGYSTQTIGFAVRQVKCERGEYATPYSAEASIVQSFQALSTLNSQYASLSTTVGTQGVTISTNSTAISTLNGNVATLFGQWVLDVQVGNVVAGMKLANNGATSSLKLRSDLVEFVGSTGSGARTEYSGGNWRIYYGNNQIAMRWGII